MTLYHLSYLAFYKTPGNHDLQLNTMTWFIIPEGSPHKYFSNIIKISDLVCSGMIMLQITNYI